MLIFCKEVRTLVPVSPKITCHRNKCDATDSTQDFGAGSSAKNKGEDKWLSKIETFIRNIHLFLSALFEPRVPMSKSPLHWSVCI